MERAGRPFIPELVDGCALCYNRRKFCLLCKRVIPAAGEAIKQAEVFYMPEKITFPLELVLTPDGFVPELPGSRHTEEGEALLARWKENRCKEIGRAHV